MKVFGKFPILDQFFTIYSLSEKIFSYYFPAKALALRK